MNKPAIVGFVSMAILVVSVVIPAVSKQITASKENMLEYNTKPDYKRLLATLRMDIGEEISNDKICSNRGKLYRNPFFPMGLIFNKLITDKKIRILNNNAIINIGQSVQQTEDNGYILTGFKGEFSSGNPSSYLIQNTLLTKYNEDGDKGWSKTFTFIDSNMGYSVQQTEDNGYIISGAAISSDNSYAMLLKTDEQGNEEWTKTYSGLGHAHGTTVQQTIDKGYILTGSSSFLNNTNSSYVFLQKTDENGHEIWSKTFEIRNNSLGNSVRQTEDQGYIITGVTEDFNWIEPGLGIEYTVLLIKTDTNGNLEWSKTFTFMDINMGYSVQQNEDKGYIIVGSVVSLEDFNSYALLLKTDERGNEEWHKTFINKNGYSVRQTEDEGYIVGGTAISSDNSYAMLLKTDEQGNEEWSKTYAGLGYALGTTVQQTIDKGYILTGTTKLKSFFSMEYYVLLLKTDKDGNLEWIKTFTKNTSFNETIHNHILVSSKKIAIQDEFSVTCFTSRDVTMPRSRDASNMLFYQLLERFPLLEKLLSFFNF